MEHETYGVNLTPHFEKYQDQDQETAEIMQETWNFGNFLKGQGYKIAYMHGPVGIYEGIVIVAETVYLEANTGPNDSNSVLPISDVARFETVYPNKDMFLFFLYQKLPNKLRAAQLLRADVDANREKNQIKRKPRKKVVKKPTLAIDIPIKEG